MTPTDYEALRASRRAILGFEDYGLQIWGGGDPSDAQVARVTAPLSYAEILGALGPVTRRTFCRGGTVQVMSDVWENCSGCCGCAGMHTAGYYNTVSYRAARHDEGRAQFEACRAIGIFVWRMAQLDAHTKLYQDVVGFDMLARIGRQIAAIGAIPAGICTFVRSALAVDKSPLKGFWYRVDGKRGKAKAHHGVEGECVWSGETSHVQDRPQGWRGTWNGRTSTTSRVGILPIDTDKPIYVPASCVTRIPTPADGADRTAKRAYVKAVRGVRPNYYGHTGRKADVGCVVAGPHKGLTGQVFWSKISDVLGSEDGRVGLKTSRDAESLWLSARDVIGPAKRFVEFAKFEIDRVADGGTISRLDTMLAGAYANAEALVDAGFDTVAEEWAAIVKQIERRLGQNVAASCG
jgi:hypothetical protein